MTAAVLIKLLQLFFLLSHRHSWWRKSPADRLEIETEEVGALAYGNFLPIDCETMLEAGHILRPASEDLVLREELVGIAFTFIAQVIILCT